MLRPSRLRHVHPIFTTQSILDHRTTAMIQQGRSLGSPRSLMDHSGSLTILKNTRAKVIIFVKVISGNVVGTREAKSVSFLSLACLVSHSLSQSLSMFLDKRLGRLIFDKRHCPRILLRGPTFQLRDYPFKVVHPNTLDCEYCKGRVILWTSGLVGDVYASVLPDSSNEAN